MLRIIPLSLLLILAACSGQSAQYQREAAVLKVQQSDLQALNYEQQEQITQLESEVRRLNQKVEDLEFIRMARKDRALKKRSQQSQQQSPEQYSDYASRADSSEPADAGRDSLEISKPANTSAVVPLKFLTSDYGTVRFDSRVDEDLFLSALDYIKNNQFSAAISNLDQLSSERLSPESKTIINFWLGVSNEALFNNKAAIAEYAKIAGQTEVKSQRVAEALSRQAAIFFRLGEKDLARLTLEKIVSDYPGSEYANRASRRLISD